MPDVDPKALKKSINAAQDRHEKVEDLVGKMDKTLTQLAKLASGKDVDKEDVQSQMKDLQRQMDALQNAVKQLEKIQDEISKNVSAR